MKCISMNMMMGLFVSFVMFGVTGCGSGGGSSTSVSITAPPVTSYDARFRNSSLKQIASTTNTNGIIIDSSVVLTRDPITGNVLTEVTTNGNNTTIRTFSYDAAGRIVAIQNGPTTITNTYNAAGNIQTKAEAGGITSYTYNSEDMPASSTLTSNGIAVTSAYAYDSNKSLVSVISSTSGTATLTWLNGQLVTFVAKDSTNTYSNSTTFTYDFSKKLTVVVNSYFDGTTTTNASISYTYNQNKIIETITSADSVTTNTYTYDGVTPTYDFYRSSSGLIFNGGLWVYFSKSIHGIL